VELALAEDPQSSSAGAFCFLSYPRIQVVDQPSTTLAFSSVIQG
jgi:hypothetical protein